MRYISSWHARTDPSFLHFAKPHGTPLRVTSANGHAPAPGLFYGTAWKEDRTAALTESALRAGFRAIDTANQRKHYFEAAAGEGIAAAYRAGIVKRQDLFLQTKFTYRRGQDHRLPYDPSARLPVQVNQSLSSSLEHLGADYVDSLLLHAPSSIDEWTDTDAEVWEALLREKTAGRTCAVGVSNVSLRHLEQLDASHGEGPAFVQNRCFARFGWDRDVRLFCEARNIGYQGFSLLTANRDVLASPFIAELATRTQSTPAQVIFGFARAVGIIALTGTSNPEHMAQDLGSDRLELSVDDVTAIEHIAGWHSAGSTCDIVAP
ncbi:MAG TPA: aldo/keto reductase [Bryobacteraceae bacterium]|nr:aldo/keto reductase [Bryobacteraceae bacterium]